MKRLQRSGIGSKRRQAEPLTLEEEELLWKKGLLGSSNPQTLLDTILFMNGIYFALRSGAEHRQLRHDPCQIELVERPGERAYLRYTDAGFPTNLLGTTSWMTQWRDCARVQGSLVIARTTLFGLLQQPDYIKLE